MNDIEKNEISRLPEKYRPLSAWAYWGLTILFSVPVVGFIFLIIFALNGSNINRRSFARSYFCVLILAAIIAAIIIAVFCATGYAALLAGIIAG